ncbi:hypothetical protein [uncultured Friedmanniella sp.]|uniref:hypothetical protein n=1 Tax=uncultured Friedmanniella sp. TaxID=335381 RepID=UPI0035C9F33A
MPAADAVLLPLCLGLSLLGLVVAILAGTRGRKGRAVQGVALALAPVALYFSGLLRLVWNGVVAVVSWASHVILSPTVWFGLSLLGLCLVLWVVGGFVARRTPKRTGVSKGAAPATTASRTAGSPAVTNGRGKQAARQPAPPVDDDLAEIEALLKSRGIE